MFGTTNAFAPIITGDALSLHVDAGVLFINGATTNVAASDVTLTANSTNSVYVDLTTGAVANSTSGFPALCFPVAVVVTLTNKISSVVDSRADCYNYNNVVPVTRPTGAQVNLFQISDNGGISSGVQTGGANQKTYDFTIAVNRPSTSPASGDSNDSMIKGSYNNYATNDSNFIIRGINMTVFGRQGVAGEFNCASFTNDIRSGQTATTSVAMYAMSDQGGIVSGVNYAADFVMRRQGATVPTEEGGIRIRNLAAGNQVDSAIRVNGEDNSIVAFAHFADCSANQFTLKQTSSKVTLFKINIGGTVYYVRSSSSAVTVENSEA